MSSKVSYDTLSKMSTVGLAFSIPIATSLTHFFLLLLVVFSLLSGTVLEGLKNTLYHPVVQAALFLYLLFIIGTFYSIGPILDRVIFLKKMAKLLYFPFLISILQEKKWRDYAFNAFLLAMVITFILGTTQYIYNALGYSKIGRYWGASFFKDHIYTSMMTAIASFFLAHYACDTARMTNKILYWGLTIAAIYFLFFLCDGRSGYVIFALLWTLFFTQRFSRKIFFFSTLGLFILLSMIFMYSGEFQDRVLLVVSETADYELGDATTSTGARLEFIKQTWTLIKERPWFGWGTGSFKEIYQAQAARHHLQNTQNPHNEYLLMLTQLGLLGLLSLLSFFFILLKNSFKLPKFEQYLVQGVLVTMVAGCMINSWLMDATSGYFFVVMVAVSFASLEFKRSGYER
jgi:O-antigen ligase